MPLDFAEKLYSITGIGTTVIIAGNKSAPSHTVRPGLLFSGKPGAPTAGFVWGAGEGTEGAYFGPDRKVYVYRNGVEIGRASVAGLETTRLSGTYV